MISKMVALSMNEKALAILDALAAQSFRSRSEQVRFLVMQEYNRQIEAMRATTPTAADVSVVYEQKGE